MKAAILFQASRAAMAALLAVTVASVQARAQRLDPAERYATLQAARAADAARNFARAAELYRKLAESYPEDGELWSKFAVASFQAGKLEPEAAEKAVRLGPSGARERMAMGLAQHHARQGHKDQAFRWIEQALTWGYTPRSSMQTDSAFLAYQDDARFRELAGMLPKRQFSRDEGWRYDVRFLADEAKRLHASFARQAYSPTFEAAVQQISAMVPKLTDQRLVVELQRLVVLLEDGHSKVNPHPAGKMLPIDVYFFSDGVFVIGGVDEGKALVGSRIVRFGSRTTEEILAELPKYVNRDNAMGIKWIGPWTVTALDFLQAMGGTDDPNRATLTVQDGSGNVRAVTLQGGAMRRIWPLKLFAPDSTSPDRPLWLRNVGTPYWFTKLPEANAVYFQFNQVQEKRDERLSEFVPRLREAVSDPSVKNLIVDVRHNSGGNSYLYPPLLRTLGGFQDASPDRRLFYLTGRNTFSAAQNFSTNVERLTNAVFVGEPTGASPNFVGEGPILFELPYSRTKATISNWYHQFSFYGDRRPWIAPAIPVELSSADYFANRDPVLDAVLTIIRRQGASTP